MPCLCLNTFAFVVMASAAFNQCVELNSTLITYLTGSGIGREVAFTLASRGAHTVVCADINMEAAKQTAKMSQSRKANHLTDYKVHALQVDVRDEDSVQQMVNQAKSLFGRIDYFVNTAGVGSIIVAYFQALEPGRGHLDIHSCFTLLTLFPMPHIADMFSHV